ncbi:TPA: hypothetical protein HA249_06410 [Candidatus Woesearchaeota archaeon]|nr:hypothetical protein [Candidatus Woesearchaeota archaeon]
MSTGDLICTAGATVLETYRRELKGEVPNRYLVKKKKKNPNEGGKSCNKKMSTKLKIKPRRYTKQVRLGQGWHLLIQKRAKERRQTISKFLDVICYEYFGRQGWREAEKLGKNVNNRCYPFKAKTATIKLKL